MSFPHTLDKFNITIWVQEQPDLELLYQVQAWGSGVRDLGVESGSLEEALKHLAEWMEEGINS